MATYSQGASLSWGGIQFTEINSLSWDYGGDRQGMASAWAPNPGTVTVSFYGSGAFNTQFVGVRETLIIAGGGSQYNGPAIYQSCSVEYEVNGVTNYTVNFTLCDVLP